MIDDPASIVQQAEEKRYEDMWDHVCRPLMERHRAQQQERDGNSHIDPAAPWLVIQSNINCEHRAIGSLAALGFETWLPEKVVEIRVGKSRNPACRKFPAVAGLLLARHANRWAWTGLHTADGVRGVVLQEKGGEVLRKDGTVAWSAPREIGPLEVEPARIGEWREALKPMPVSIVDDAFVIGADMRITGGPFLGFQGTVERLVGKAGVVVAVHVFGRPTPVAVRREQVEVV